MSEQAHCKTCGVLHPVTALPDGTRRFSCPKAAEWWGIVAVDLPPRPVKPIAFEVPYPPSANVYWRIWRGHAVVSNEARAYKRNVLLALKASGVRPVEGPLRLVLRVYRPRKAGDLSNRIKVLEDALQGGAYGDDDQIVSIVADRFDDKARPRVEVEIHAVGREAA